MRIAVFGASGKSGLIFVTEALADGHTIIANVHNHNPFKDHAHLTIIAGDATDPSVATKVIQGSDAVVSLVGHGRKTPRDMQTVIAANIVSAMQATGNRRLISLTGTGVRFDGDHVILADKIITYILTRVDRYRIKDGVDHATVLKESGLDWTIIRVLKLQNTSMRPYTLREHGPTKLYTSRHEVASAILDLLESGLFIGQAPIISN